MGRPRIHPRRYYRAIETGVYFDQETGEEITYFSPRHPRGPTVLPNKDIEQISMSRQEKLAKKLVSFGVFEPLSDYPGEVIERDSNVPTSVEEVK